MANMLWTPTAHAVSRPLLLLLLLSLLSAAAAAAGNSQPTGVVPPMTPPIVLDDPNTPLTYEWPYEGPWPLADENEDALATEASYYETFSTGVELSGAERKLAGIDDVFDDVKGFFQDVGRNIRRRILQVPVPAPAPAPTTPAPPATPPTTPANPAAPTQPAPTPAPTTPPATGGSTVTPGATTTPGTPATSGTGTTTTTPGTTPTTPGGTTTTPGSTTTTTPGTTTSGAVTTKPPAKPDVAVTPTDIQPGENVPQAVQQQQDAAKQAAEAAAAQAAAGQMVQSSVPADVVSAAFQVPGISPDTFSSWYLPSVLSTLSQLSGTPSDQWKATFTAKAASGRALRQATSDYVAVSMSILTRNPQLVVFRLAQAPATAAAGNGCTTELCVRLLAANVPINASSVVITPDMSTFQFGNTPTNSPLDASLANTQRIGAIVGACVGGALLLVLLLFTYKKIINCFRGQVNAIKAKRQAAAAVKAAPNKLQAQTLPKTLDPTASLAPPPCAEPPVKFLSLSSTAGANELPPQATRVVHRQNSLANSHQSSSNGDRIPVGPVTGPASITPWAESDESCSRDDQGQGAMSVVPTAATLAAVAQQQPVVLYKDSSSFRQWAETAVMRQGSNTPTGSSAGSGGHNKSFDGMAAHMSEATAADLAAAMPGSPISSPMYAPPNRHRTSDGSTHSAARYTTPYATPAVGSPAVRTALTVDVLQLQQALDQYYLQQSHRLAAAAAAGTNVSAPGALRRPQPASPVAAAGWGAVAGAATGAGGSVMVPPKSPLQGPNRLTSAPASPMATAGVVHSPLRPSSASGNRTSSSEPLAFAFPPQASGGAGRAQSRMP